MDKPAPGNYPLTDNIQHRWSPRAFSDRPVEDWKLRRIFEAARWAPSSFNEQPWRFVVGIKGQQQETYDKILDLLVPQNQAWAKNAPVLLISIAKLKFAHNNRPNRHAYHDVGLASENLVLEAQALGIYCHMMAGFDADRTLDVFGIPRGEYEAVAGMALGYAGSPDMLGPELKERELAPRERDPLSDLFFSDYWRGPFPL